MKFFAMTASRAPAAKERMSRTPATSLAVILVIQAGVKGRNNLLRENLRHGDAHLGQRERADLFVSRDGEGCPVSARARIAEDAQRTPLKIDHPRFSDARARVQRYLRVEVEPKRRVRDLDHQQSIRGDRMRLRIVVGAWLEQNDVGLRYRALTDDERALPRYDRPIARKANEEAMQDPHHGGMQTPDRRRL